MLLFCLDSKLIDRRGGSFGPTQFSDIGSGSNALDTVAFPQTFTVSVALALVVFIWIEAADKYVRIKWPSVIE